MAFAACNRRVYCSERIAFCVHLALFKSISQSPMQRQPLSTGQTSGKTRHPSLKRLSRQPTSAPAACLFSRASALRMPHSHCRSSFNKLAHSSTQPQLKGQSSVLIASREGQHQGRRRRGLGCARRSVLTPCLASGRPSLPEQLQQNRATGLETKYRNRFGSMQGVPQPVESEVLHAHVALVAGDETRQMHEGTFQQTPTRERSRPAKHMKRTKLSTWQEPFSGCLKSCIQLHPSSTCSRFVSFRP